MEGPDEDPFTLAVAALESLSPPVGVSEVPLERVELVGEFPTDTDWGLDAALGLPTLDVRHHATGPESFFQAVTSAAHGGGGAHRVAVVTADVAGTDAREAVERRGVRGAVATVCDFADGPGARLLGHVARNHPTERAPDATAWVRAARSAAGEGREGGLLQLLADATPPVLLARWQKEVPSVPVEVHPWSLEGWGILPASRCAIALRDLLGKGTNGSTAWLAAVRPDRTDFLAFATDTSVVPGPAPVDGGATCPAPGDRPFRTPPGMERAVSEGAYVPRPRYLEHLASRWRFTADRCGRCGAATFPQRGLCRSCGAAEGLSPFQLAYDGLEVEAVTTVARGAQPTEFDPLTEAVGSYAVVIVRWPEGVRATLQVTDAPTGSVAVGQRLSSQLRRLYPMEGAWRYGRKALPSAPQSTS